MTQRCFAQEWPFRRTGCSSSSKGSTQLLRGYDYAFEADIVRFAGSQLSGVCQRTKALRIRQTFADGFGCLRQDRERCEESRWGNARHGFREQENAGTAL